MAEGRDEIEWDIVVDTTYRVVEDMMGRGYARFDGTVARVLKVGGNYQVYGIQNKNYIMQSIVS